MRVHGAQVRRGADGDVIPLGPLDAQVNHPDVAVAAAGEEDVWVGREERLVEEVALCWARTRARRAKPVDALVRGEF